MGSYKRYLSEGGYTPPTLTESDLAEIRKTIYEVAALKGLNVTLSHAVINNMYQLSVWELVDGSYSTAVFELSELATTPLKNILERITFDW